MDAQFGIAKMEAGRQLRAPDPHIIQTINLSAMVALEVRMPIMLG